MVIIIIINIINQYQPVSLYLLVSLSLSLSVSLSLSLYYISIYLSLSSCVLITSVVMIVIGSISGIIVIMITVIGTCSIVYVSCLMLDKSQKSQS